MSHFKTISWTKFVKLVANTESVRLSDVPHEVSFTLVSPPEQIRIEWKDSDGAEYCFYVSPEHNKRIPVEGHSATLVGDPDPDDNNSQETFVFQFFNLQPKEI